MTDNTLYVYSGPPQNSIVQPATLVKVDYNLNSNRALKAKLNATKRQPITFKPTKGGLRIYMQTALCGVIRSILSNHTANEPFGLGCEIVWSVQQDRKGNCVQHVG